MSLHAAQGDCASRRGQDGRLSHIAALFDGVCEIEEGVPRAVDEEFLFAEERAYIAGSSPRRRAEFGSTRRCARRALSRLGIAAAPLVPRDDQAPRWPAGSVGSISHTQGYCAVVVARSERVRSLGLDVERDRPLARELVDMVCTERERCALLAHPRGAIVYFSAKEAVYKCQYPITRRLLDFHDVELTIDFATGRFIARICEHTQLVPDWPRSMSGHWLARDGLVSCGLTLYV